MFSNQDVTELGHVLLAQFVAVLGLALACLAILGSDYAKSCLMGGMVSLLPTWLFAWLLFYDQGSPIPAEAFVRAFFRSEGLKLLLAAGLFLLFVQYFHPIWWVCLLSCLCTQLSLSVAPILWGEGQAV